MYNQLVIRSILYITQQNTDFNEVVSLDVFDSTVYVNREGDFTRADIFSVDEMEIFEGRENRITMVQTYSKKFHCTYLLQNFPFDTQVIFFQISKLKDNPKKKLEILFFIV